MRDRSYRLSSLQTWIPNPILSEDDRSPDPGSNIVQAPDAAPDNLDPGSATSDPSNANAKGTQRAEGQGSSSRDGYIQMRSEVFVGETSATLNKYVKIKVPIQMKATFVVENLFCGNLPRPVTNFDHD